MRYGAFQSVGDITRGRVFLIAAPIILSNASMVMPGAVDTAVLGRLGDAVLIAAGGVGAAMFALLYSSFNFLQMGTSGMSAQAVGRRDEPEVAATLFRAGAIALAVATALLVLQVPLRLGLLWIIGPADAVAQQASEYFALRAWGAPAHLMLLVLIGWFIGQARTFAVFVIQIALNLLNVVLDLWLGLWLGWGIVGVAIGTVIAEWLAAALGLSLAAWSLRGSLRQIRWTRVFDPARVLRMVRVNADIFLRTILLISAFFSITVIGARLGSLTLAANVVLIHFFHVSAYALDGFAAATETLVGQSVGRRSRAAFDRAIRLTTEWGAVAAVVASLIYFGFGGVVIDVFTVDPAVRAEAREYLIWAALAPVTGVWCFILDGVFFGATRGRDMRNAMVVASATYVVAVAALTAQFGNHGLWMAIHVFFIARAVALWVRVPAIRADISGTDGGSGRLVRAV